MNNEDLQFNKIGTGLDSRYQLWEQILRNTKAQIVAEIGVWKGTFAKYILERCDLITRYYMIDPWANLPNWNKPFNVSTEEFNEIYVEAIQKTEFAAAKRIILRGTSREVIDKIPEDSLDFAYIDGDHTLRGITIDLIKIYPKMKEGGFIGGDDFIADPWQQGTKYEPTLVCPFSIYFAEAMNLPIVVLPFNQFVIQKKANSAFSFIDTTGHYNNFSLARHSHQPNLPTIKKRVKRILYAHGSKGNGPAKKASSWFEKTYNIVFKTKRSDSNKI